MKINEKIIQLRKQKNLSQVDLADAIGVSRQTISKWESGDSLPDLANLQALSTVFGVSADYLLNDVDSMKEQSNYPEWVEHLPGTIRSLIQRYGWVYGAKVAVGGIIIIIVFGLFARFLFHTMIFETVPSGFSPFTSESEFYPQWQIPSIFTGFIVAIGAVMTVVGLVLAVALKKWGQQTSGKNS